ncbi:hypothetical protein Mgra_00005140 [Meloidogyne graminicola]|uniref:Uncharacterized protein n=1 Tax=Meloidogyne graminicola TaxID=189291 RepID=A0A8S9ZPT6_9BILA|nr:hypothetical protein Mgra_00005140 [Meloidogyne graminicola]
MSKIKKFWQFLINRTISNKLQVVKEVSLPEYLERIKIITGLAGTRKYKADIVKRINSYRKEGNYEALLSLVVIHHGKNLFEIIKNMSEEFKGEKLEEEKIKKDLLNFQLKGVDLKNKLNEEKNKEKDKKEELKNKIKINELKKG